MIKRILLITFLTLLCSCGYTNNINEELDRIFVSEDLIKKRANNYSTYIEYYLPSDVYEGECNEISYSFNIDGGLFVMNISISNILNSNLYENRNLSDEGYFDEKNIVYSKQGRFVNLNNEDTEFFFRVYEYENMYFINLMSNELIFYGKCSKDKVTILASKIYEMAKASNVHDDKIVTDFSNIDVIDYERSEINLFEDIFPINGRIDDLMIDNNNVAE